MWVRTLLLCAAVLSWVGEVSAEPYIAVREGYKCSACHVNKTGGGMRTSFVAVHAQDILHYPDWFSELTSPADQFSGEINKYVSIGADLRVDATATFQDTPKNGEVRNNQVFRGRLDEFEIDVQEAVGYLEVKLIPDLLTAYVDLRFAPNTDAREAWALMYLPWDVWIKGGKMFLPYGLQLQDDTAFIRGGRNGSATTGFSFNQQQAAFQIGWEPGPWFAAFAVSDGPSGDRDVQLTGTVYGMFTDLPVVGNWVRNFLIGGSATRVSPSGSDTVVAGAFTGFNIGLFTYLGEVDFRWDKNMATDNQRRGHFIHYSEGNFLLFDWLNAKIAFDYADYDGDLAQSGDDNENRFSVGLEPFLARFLQLRLFYRIGNGVRSRPDHNQNLLIGELHVFF